MAATALLRLLPLVLLLLLPSGLREHLSPAATKTTGRRTKQGVGELLHPIVLVPGVSCCKLEARLTDAYRPSVPRCGAMKGKGWFGLWDNTSDVAAHHNLRCLVEQMGLVYDPVADDYHNRPGVETRVPNFGSSRTFITNPEHTDWCLAMLRRELERIGYRDGDTLFGAPYDIRHAPPLPGHGPTSRVFSRYFRQLTALVEDASSRNQGRKVILFGHSFGGLVARHFAASAPMAWRRRYVKHLVLAAPLPPAGFVDTIKFLASGPDVLSVGAAAPLSLRPMWRTFESALVSVPSPAVFGRAPLVVTAARNYSSYDIPDFLAAIGLGDGVRPLEKRWPERAGYFRAPMVPTTCINGVGVDTPERLVYRDDDFDAAPEIAHGDGDGIINLAGMLAFDEEMRRQPGQRQHFKSIKLAGARHSALVTDFWALKRVMREILQANGI